MKYLFIAFLFISSISYGQGIEPSSFQPTPYLGGVLRGVTPFVDEFTGQTYYLYVHDSLDAAVPYVDTIFMTDFNLYYIKNGDTIYVGSVTDSSFIYNVVSDTFALDMDIDSTNELQELFHQDNILVLTGAGPDSQVDLTTYMNVDTIYMNDYDLWYYNLLESEPYFIGNVTDSSYIKQVVSDSSTVVENDYGTIIVESPANTFGVTVDSTKFATPYDLTQINFIDSTNVLNSYGTVITESPANTFNIKVDSSLYATTYDMTLKENYITPGTTSQYWRGDKTWQTTPTGTVTGTGTTNYIPKWTSSTALGNSIMYDSGSGIGIGTTSPGSDILNVSGNTQLNGYLRVNGGGNIWIQNSSIAIPSDAGTQNTVIGFNVGNPAGMSGAINNFLLGINTALGLTTGDVNVAIGQGTMSGITSGSNNVAVGDNALNGASNTSYVTAVGPDAGKNATSTFGGGYFGSGAGQGTSVYCFAFGEQALRNNTGIYSNAFGALAGYGNTGANSNFFGFKAGMGNTRNYSLYIDNDETFVPLIGGQFDNNRVGINTNIASITDALHVTGNIRGTAAYIDATNSPGTSGQVLSSTVTGTDWIDLPAGDITAVTVTAPIIGGGTSGSVNIAIDTARADGSSKGAASFAAADFNSSAGNITIDYANGQEATSGVDGFLKSSDWTTFNNKFTLPSLTSGSVLISDGSTISQENAQLFWDFTNNRLGIGTNLPTNTLSVAGVVKVTGSASGNTVLWGRHPSNFTMGAITVGAGLSLSGDELTATGGAYDYWRLSANDGTPYAVTDDALIDFENSTGITWTRSGGEMTATLADNSATNEIQSLSYNTGTRALGISSGSGVTLPLVTSSIPGLVSAYPNNTTSFLRGDGTWATPPTPSVTGTAPIVVTSGNISLNFGNGLALSGSQLQTTPVIMAFLNHSSGGYTTNFTAGETKKVDFTTALSNSSITTDVSTNDNITINSAGTYEINYNVCINAPTNFDEPTVSIYVNGSQQGTTVKSVWLTVAGQKQCISGTHVMALSSSNTVDMRVQHPQAQTGANIIAPQLKVQKLF